MIITCPACATRYVVPDGAVGADGRTVRCAKCRHSWFQDGPPIAVAAPQPEVQSAPPTPSQPSQPEPPHPQAAAPEPVPSQREPVPEPAFADAAPRPAHPMAAAAAASVLAEPPLRAAAEPVAPPPPVYSDEDEGGAQDSARSTFDFEPPFRPRRNLARMWMVAAMLFALVAIGATVVMMRHGLPDWVPITRPTFAEAQPNLVLDFPPNRQDRRTLPNGAEFFGASGTVTNVGQSRQSVPTILIVLRDRSDRIVYSWEVAPPKRQLAPGESVTINEAMTDVPRSATAAEIGWKPG